MADCCFDIDSHHDVVRGGHHPQGQRATVLAEVSECHPEGETHKLGFQFKFILLVSRFRHKPLIRLKINLLGKL